MTPNGKILPKLHTTIEYNLFLKSINVFLKILKIDDLFSLFRMPVIRYKPATPKYANRNYSTEISHLEAWYGHSNDTITLQIPLLGDINKNYTELLSPPDNFDESWLEPLDDFKLGKNIADKYLKINTINEISYMKIFDAATLHKTIRKDNCGPRISLDMMLIWKNKLRNQAVESGRSVDLGLTPENFLKLGSKNIFIPKNTRSGMIEAEKIIDLNNK